MLPALVLGLLTAPAFDPTGPKNYPPAYIPAEAPFGYLYAPAFDVHPLPRYPIAGYSPKAGDVLLMSDTNRFWTFLHRLALTGKPGHNGIVVTMPEPPMVIGLSAKLGSSHSLSGIASSRPSEPSE